MAKLRHIAIAVPDPARSAAFYAEVFGLEIVGETESPLASGVYLSDGTVCLALLNYKTDEAAGLERGRDDVDAQTRSIETHGGTFFMELPVAKDSLYFEAKFRDPDGIIFDVSHNGW